MIFHSLTFNLALLTAFDSNQLVAKLEQEKMGNPDTLDVMEREV